MSSRRRKQQTCSVRKNNLPVNLEAIPVKGIPIDFESLGTTFGFVIPFAEPETNSVVVEPNPYEQQNGVDALDLYESLAVENSLVSTWDSVNEFEGVKELFETTYREFGPVDCPSSSTSVKELDETTVNMIKQNYEVSDSIFFPQYREEDIYQTQHIPASSQVPPPATVIFGGSSSV